MISEIVILSNGSVSNNFLKDAINACFVRSDMNNISCFYILYCFMDGIYFFIFDTVRIILGMLAHSIPMKMYIFWTEAPYVSNMCMMS